MNPLNAAALDPDNDADAATVRAAYNGGRRPIGDAAAWEDWLAGLGFRRGQVAVLTQRFAAEITLPCPVCARPIPLLRMDAVPDPADPAAWGALAADHQAGCSWLAGRAGQDGDEGEG